MEAFTAAQHGKRVADVINLGRMADQLIQHEGLRLRPYRCSAGKLTIGVGRNIEDVGITQDEAMTLLANDIARVITELEANVPCFHGLDETRKRVLIDMTFNLGLARFLQFKRMLSALDQGKYREAANEMLDSRWARQVGKRAARLARMMKTGETE